MSWQSIRFGDAYSEPSRNGVYKSKEHHGAGAKIVNMGELFRYDFIAGQQMARLQMSDTELSKSGLCDGDLLFGRRSLVETGAGKCSLVTHVGEKTTFESSLIRVRVKRDILDPRFVFYWFKSPIGRGRIRAIVSGVNVKGIRGSDLQNIVVVHPDLPTQKRIASILSAYDDLIENNLRRIGLLEQSALLLYREWFVNLRFPGHETVKIVDGRPVGWQTKRLPEVADFHLGKMLDQRKNKGDNLPYLANVNVRWGSFELSDLREMRFEEKELERFGLKNRDILMCEGGEPGRCAIWREQLPRMMFQKALHRIRPIEGMNSEFLYWSLFYRAKRGQFSGLFTGSTIKHLPKEKLALVRIDVPSQEILNEFERIITPLSLQSAELSKANTRLTRARDLLLPRLMDERIPV